MISYYCNDSLLELSNVRSLVDLTRQFLEIVTEDGAELELVIERFRGTENVSLAAAVESSLAERKRSLRGFETVSLAEREYPNVIGVEARLSYVDKERGPRFVHEFYCTLDTTRIGYFGSCRMPHAAACDEWMQTTLESLKLR